MKQKNTDKSTQAKPADELRNRAEVIARGNAILSPEHFEELTPKEVRQTLHELRVYQIELEIQNEELRLTQEKLESARAHYFDLYDMAPVGYFTLNEKGLILEANLTAATLLGVRRVDLVGRLLSGFIAKEDQEICYLHRKQLFETGEAQVSELRMVKKNGTEFWAHMEATTAPNNDGEAVHRVAVIDISAQKQTREALQERIKELRCLYDTSSLLELPGISLDEALKRAVMLIPPAFQFPEITEASIILGRKTFQTARFRETSWMLNREVIVNGNLVGQVVVCYLEERQASDEGPFLEEERKLINVIAERFGRFTELKRAEEALSESEERFRRLANATWEGIIIHREGIVMDANESASKILGCPVEEIIGKNVVNFLAPESIEAASQKLREGTTHDQLYLEVKGLRKDKTAFSAEVMGRPLRYNNIDARVLAFRDITERKQAEEALRDRTAQIEAANKELESFSYSVSHDLRAPLRAIDGYSRMILKKQGEKFDEETRRQFNMIRDNSQAMSRLIDDLLAFSRLGRQVMAMSSLAMDNLIREVWQELQIINPGRRITLNIVDPMPCGMGDRALMKQVFSNILSNAIKFTKVRDEALIEAGGYVKDNETVYYVKDNGVGFDMQYYDKLFSVFQRLHHANDYEGTGIGLALVQRIIHRHGGQIWAEGEIDQGACFYFTLPRT